jgi:hypothetical protein
MAVTRFGERLSGQIDNLEATAAPGATNDTTEGYVVGSRWIDVTADLSYVCVDCTEDAAVWNLMAAVALTPSVEDWGDITNGTEDRVMDCNSTTIDELADVLATLISDLVVTGILVAPA